MKKNNLKTILRVDTQENFLNDFKKHLDGRGISITESIQLLSMAKKMSILVDSEHLKMKFNDMDLCLSVCLSGNENELFFVTEM